MSADRSGIPRPIEALLALLGIVVVSPVLLLAAIAVKLSSSGPAIFRQERVGRSGRRFTLYKLRSMREGPVAQQVTARGDSRITAIGRILRGTKLDELPELWNVVIGDLSLVGPRPEVPKYVDLSDPLWQEVLSVRPGLTDPVTIELRNEERLLASVGAQCEDFYRDVLVRYKLLGNVEYLRDRSPWTDVDVLMRTAVAIVSPWHSAPPTADDVKRVSSGSLEPMNPQSPPKPKTVE